MSSAGHTYLDEVIRLLSEVQADQGPAIDKAAELVADTVVADGLVHVFGTGHSHLLAEELFYRAGGLAQINPILVDVLMLHAGAARSTRIERLPGLGTALADEADLRAGDLVVVISNSGGNATCLEVAAAARSRGISTIALTSLQHATAAEARNPGGQRLHDLVDVVLDNRGRPGDAAVTVDGFDQPVGPTSTVVGAAILQAVAAAAVELLVARGHRPDVFASSNLADGDRVNADLIARYSPRVRAL